MASPRGTSSEGWSLHPLRTAWAEQVDEVFAEINASGETGQPDGVLVNA